MEIQKKPDLMTWKEEFYPVSAKDVAHTMSAKQAIEHAIKKWKGLTSKSLAKHNVIIEGALDVKTKDRPEAKKDCIRIDMGTCALCMMFYQSPNEYCSQCPIFTSMGRQCDEEYKHWCKTKDPQPMLDLLQATLEHQEQIMGASGQTII